MDHTVGGSDIGREDLGLGAGAGNIPGAVFQGECEVTRRSTVAHVVTHDVGHHNVLHKDLSELGVVRKDRAQGIGADLGKSVVCRREQGERAGTLEGRHESGLGHGGKEGGEGGHILRDGNNINNVLARGTSGLWLQHVPR